MKKALVIVWALLAVAALACDGSSEYSSGDGVRTPTPTKFRQPTATPEPISTKSPEQAEIERLLALHPVKVVDDLDVAFGREECYAGICMEMCGDTVLAIRDQPLHTVILGSDSRGLIVAWIYEDATFIFRYRSSWGSESNVFCYRVAEIYR